MTERKIIVKEYQPETEFDAELNLEESIMILQELADHSATLRLFTVVADEEVKETGKADTANARINTPVLVERNPLEEFEIW